MDISAILNNFNKRGFKALYFETPEAAKEFLSKNISSTTVGIGGSMTVKELEIYEMLAKDNEVHSHFVPTSDDAVFKASHCETYICSANALSATGAIVNIDGKGNRVAASIFGESLKRVFFVCGTNKIAEDMDKALWRAKNIAAPMNARRLSRKTPCAVNADKCYSCNSPDRICRVTSIMTNPMFNIDAYLILIEGAYGY